MTILLIQKIATSTITYVLSATLAVLQIPKHQARTGKPVRVRLFYIPGKTTLKTPYMWIRGEHYAGKRIHSLLCISKAVDWAAREQACSRASGLGYRIQRDPEGAKLQVCNELIRARCALHRCAGGRNIERVGLVYQARYTCPK